LFFLFAPFDHAFVNLLSVTLGPLQASFDVPEMIQQEYFSYICFQINTNMLDTGK
jgi:hypothetical protein